MTSRPKPQHLNFPLLKICLVRALLGATVPVKAAQPVLPWKKKFPDSDDFRKGLQYYRFTLYTQLPGNNYTYSFTYFNASHQAVIKINVAWESPTGGQGYKIRCERRDKETLILILSNYGLPLRTEKTVAMFSPRAHKAPKLSPSLYKPKAGDGEGGSVLGHCWRSASSCRHWVT